MLLHGLDAAMEFPNLFSIGGKVSGRFPQGRRSAGQIQLPTSAANCDFREPAACSLEGGTAKIGTLRSFPDGMLKDWFRQKRTRRCLAA